MIEIILKILLAVFAVFGLYAFAHVLGELFFQNDRIHLMLLVDSSTVADEIDLHLEEAKSAQFVFCKRKICAVVMEKYATEGFLQALSQKGISWEIVKDREH